MADEFKEGDLVNVRGQDPKRVLTVSVVRLTFGPPMVDCVWFTDTGKLQNACFDVALLIKLAPGVKLA